MKKNKEVKKEKQQTNKQAVEKAKALWVQAKGFNKKNYKTLSEAEKRLFWVKKVQDVLKNASKLKEFEKNGTLMLESNGVSVNLTWKYLKCKGVEKNGKRATYSIKFVSSSMHTTYYNVVRFLRKGLGV